MENKKKEQKIVQNLKDIKIIFDKYNVFCWLDWGSLLGAVRDNKIIEWDHEVDLGIMNNDFEKINLMIPEIKNQKFFVTKAPISAPRFTFRRDGYGIDVWLYYKINENFWATDYHEPKKGLKMRILWLFWRLLAPEYGKADLSKKGIKLTITNCVKFIISVLPIRIKNYFIKYFKRILTKNNYRVLKKAIVPKHYFDKFKTINFYKMIFNIPFNVEDYLEYKYGKSWKIPTKNWGIKDDGAVKSSKKHKE